MAEMPAAESSPQTAQPATAQTDIKVLYWYDPMTPGARFDKPGKSPFMDMDLVPRYADEAADNAGITISDRQQQNLGMRTASVARIAYQPEIAAFGTVTADESRVKTLPALTSGVVEKLYVSSPQQQVAAQQPLALLWLPQWTAAQQEYLAVRQLGDAPLTAAASAHLQLQFMPEETIRALERSGQAQRSFTLRAPAAGYISNLAIREGAQVNAGQTLFELTSLDRLWLIVDYPDTQASELTVGSQIVASADSWPGETFSGTVSELLPVVRDNTRTLQARVALDNRQQRLKPGMYLNVQLQPSAASSAVLAIPQEALILTGNSNRVLLSEGNGTFRAVNVTTGRRQSDWVEILSGLSEGQQVVTSGQFLIDSEASLCSALPDDQPAKEQP
ncbi:efflux RND transporter periplasmic adaptor subunit [Erwinia sp. V71]|uniref:efflux RND transporter periplasmic adaptor subunit n=1 Tax=Erwinia sp. V71 TaxID=3369424 RepID=UPI003F5E69EE